MFPVHMFALNSSGRSAEGIIGGIRRCLCRGSPGGGVDEAMVGHARARRRMNPQTQLPGGSMTAYRMKVLLLMTTAVALNTGTANAADADHNQWWKTQQRYEVCTGHEDSPLYEAPASSSKNTKHLTTTLGYDGDIVHLEMGADGLPCNVQVEGVVLDSSQKQIGTFSANFPSCPSFVGVPQELAGNLYGIPEGTVMPAWDGTVNYSLNNGDVYTTERAWIFPTDLQDPLSPLAVLSTARVDGGSKKYQGAYGTVLTPDGYDGHGSLVVDMYVSK
jgi:hypothetical protein